MPVPHHQQLVRSAPLGSNVLPPKFCTDAQESASEHQEEVEVSKPAKEAPETVLDTTHDVFPEENHAGNHEDHVACAADGVQQLVPFVPMPPVAVSDNLDDSQDGRGKEHQEAMDLHEVTDMQLLGIRREVLGFVRRAHVQVPVIIVGVSVPLHQGALRVVGGNHWHRRVELHDEAFIRGNARVEKPDGRKIDTAVCIDDVSRVVDIDGINGRLVVPCAEEVELLTVCVVGAPEDHVSVEHVVAVPDGKVRVSLDVHIKDDDLHFLTPPDG